MIEEKIGMGKLPPKLLKENVLNNLGTPSESILLAAGIGEDAAVVKLKENRIVLAADPITGSIKDIGKLAIHINANDISIVGAKPKWFLSTILLPKNTTIQDINLICKQLDETAKSLGISIVGGHTEITDTVNKVIISGSMIGELPHGLGIISTAGAKPGDQIILTKSLGLEGTAILAREREDLRKKLTNEELDQCDYFLNKISVVEEALISSKVGKVNSMHDPTEGGLAGGLHEISNASNTGFKIEESKIHISAITRKVCKILKIDPFNLISSGTLLVISSKEESNKILKELREHNIQSEIIGYIHPDPEKRTIVKKSGEEKDLKKPLQDELWDGLKRNIE
ncbi:MAG: AIR synthase family protein [Candidatus Ranarchaeia archaeon]